MGTTKIPPKAPSISKEGTASCQVGIHKDSSKTIPIKMPTGSTDVACFKRRRVATHTAPTTTPSATMPCM